ncbi:hypothetical protein [Frankia sp. R82]|nr:hypothetical protein [Frankia sp. R82]
MAKQLIEVGGDGLRIEFRLDAGRSSTQSLLVNPGREQDRS